MDYRVSVCAEGSGNLAFGAVISRLALSHVGVIMYGRFFLRSRMYAR